MESLLRSHVKPMEARKQAARGAASDCDRRARPLSCALGQGSRSQALWPCAVGPACHQNHPQIGDTGQ